MTIKDNVDCSLEEVAGVGDLLQLDIPLVVSGSLEQIDHDDAAGGEGVEDRDPPFLEETAGCAAAVLDEPEGRSGAHNTTTSAVGVLLVLYKIRIRSVRATNHNEREEKQRA